MTIKRHPLLSAGLILAAATLALNACYPATEYYKKETAERLAAPSFMVERQIQTDTFLLTVYERIHQKGGVANIYIEGNGNQSAENVRLNKNFTPKNPVALHLSAFDHAKNVIYMARPCQYSKDPVCNGHEGAPGMYSETAIKSMNDALSKIKTRYDLKGFNLIGYGGGAVVAVVLSAERDDVMTLRTVSGHLDIAGLQPAKGDASDESAHKNIASDALNPLDYAPIISALPQHHFMGEHDQFISPEVYMDYYHATNPKRCLRFSIVEDADNTQGMVNAWPNLMNMPVDCTRTEAPGTIIINKIAKY